MTEEVVIEPVASEPVPEPTPAPESVAEPVVVEEIPTAQPVEPLPEPTPDPISAPEIQTPEPVPVPEPVPTPSSEPAPVSQPQISTPPIIQTSLARELLIKARDVIQFRKRKKLEKIMNLFLKKQSITNDDVQKLLYVSDATATRYLDQLEREGKIQKQGSGKYLSYSRI